jgi:outer membrane protein assembly factor BamD (BamD/ComL family)
MGRKQSGTGKYIYLCITCLISVGLLSCVFEKELKKEDLDLKQASEQLNFAKRMLEQGNYEGSMEENSKALETFPNMPIADEALFNMGLIYAHYKNPKKDYKKSRFFFEKLLKEYPISPLVEQSRIWIGLLLVIERSKEVDIKMEEMKKELLR